jgi:hypothetical protein
MSFVIKTVLWFGIAGLDSTAILLAVIGIQCLASENGCLISQTPPPFEIVNMTTNPGQTIIFQGLETKTCSVKANVVAEAGSTIKTFWRGDDGILKLCGYAQSTEGRIFSKSDKGCYVSPGDKYVLTTYKPDTIHAIFSISCDSIRKALVFTASYVVFCGIFLVNIIIYLVIRQKKNK